jgi:GT2 family glycosyltransferase
VTEPASANARAPLDVVVVAYRSGAVIRRCLTAACAFAPAGTRFLIVDNSPDDPSAALAARGLPSATLLPQATNVGFAAAVNAAIATGDAPVILLLNPDVVRLEGSFDTVLRILSSADRAGAVTVRQEDEAGTLMHCRRQPRWSDFLAQALSFDARMPRGLRRRGYAMTEWDHADERVVDTATGAALFIRRDVYDAVGPFDERFFMYWEETDWLLRARQAGWKLVFTPDVDALHLDRSSSDVDVSTHSTLLLESSYRYSRKHFGVWKSMVLRLAWFTGDLSRLLVATVHGRRGRARALLSRLHVHAGHAARVR